MIVRRMARRAALAVATVALIPLGLVATSQPASAETEAYWGTTTTSVNVRSAPTSASTKVDWMPHSVTIPIQCKVFGPAVSGNSLWYKWGAGKWITARYVTNLGEAPPFCGSGREYVGRVASQTSLAVRSGPNTANARVGSAGRGQELALVCKVDSQSVGGNRRWYQLTGDGGGQWVAARYVTNVGTAPPYC